MSQTKNKSTTSVYRPEMTFRVKSDACCADLDAFDVGTVIVIWEVTAQKDRPDLVRYWAGARFWLTYADAFDYWVKKGGLVHEPTNV